MFIPLIAFYSIIAMVVISVIMYSSDEVYDNGIGEEVKTLNELEIEKKELEIYLRSGIENIDELDYEGFKEKAEEILNGKEKLKNKNFMLLNKDGKLLFETEWITLESNNARYKFKLFSEIIKREKKQEEKELFLSESKENKDNKGKEKDLFLK